MVHQFQIIHDLCSNTAPDFLSQCFCFMQISWNILYHGRIRTIITFHQRRETSQAFCPMHRIKVINMRSNAFTLFDALSAHIAVSSDIIIFTTPNTLNNASKLRLP
eukprot:463947_1